MVLYRILSFVVNIFCAFIAVVTIFLLLFGLSVPPILIECFLMAGVVLYGWFSNRFYASVLMGKQTMTRRQKDWLLVNAIVAFIFSVLGIAGILIFLFDPQVVEESLKQLPMQSGYSLNQYNTIAIVFLVLYVILFVHIIWTYLLVRQHKDFFIQ
jgi:hypothetical protein